jgi:hypothetical protein
VKVFISGIGMSTVFTRSVYFLWNFRNGALKEVLGPRYEIGEHGEIRSPRTRFMRTEYETAPECTQNPATKPSRG